MASVNKVILVGNVGRDPEIRTTETSTIASFSMATSRKYNNREGVLQEETEWHRVVFFGRTADVVKQYVRKGSPLYVEGRLRTRKYTDQNQQERYITEIMGEQLQLLGRRGEEMEAQAAPASYGNQAAQAPSYAASQAPAQAGNYGGYGQAPAAAPSYASAPAAPSYSSAPAPAPAPAPKPTVAPQPSSHLGVDSLEDEDVPF